MSRSMLFKRVRRLMRMASVANKENLTDAELIAKMREARVAASTRRDFLKSAGLVTAGAAAATTGLFSVEKAVAAAVAAKTPWVRIIGGGAAGLAAAYQLRKAGVKFVIYEASARLGGRILTERNVNKDGQFIERGAELVDTNHYTLRGIAEELGVEIEDFRESDKDYNLETFFFEGKVRTDEEFVVGVRPLLEKISAARDEIYGDADEYINVKALEAMPNIAKYDALSIADFLKASAEGIESWVLSAVNVAYLCEYGRETEEQSSINLIDFIDVTPDDGFDMFGDSDESKRVKGGNDTLIQAIVKKLELVEGRDYVLNTELVEAKRAPDGRVILAFETKKVVKEAPPADYVICTIPFTVLRNIKGFTKDTAMNGISAEKIACIEEMGYGTNTKMMIVFKERFWRKQQGAVEANTGVLYSDTTSQSFWETSRLQAGKSGILTNFTGGKRGLEIATQRDQVRVPAEQALGDLGQVYSSELINGQYSGVVKIMPWPIIPTTLGSYSCPLVGQYSTIWGYQADVEVDGRLHFAGEHTHPLTYGFMNGAYSSGIRAASDILTAMNVPVPEIPGRNLVPEGAEDGDN